MGYGCLIPGGEQFSKAPAHARSNKRCPCRCACSRKHMPSDVAGGSAAHAYFLNHSAVLIFACREPGIPEALARPNYPTPGNPSRNCARPDEQILHIYIYIYIYIWHERLKVGAQSVHRLGLT